VLGMIEALGFVQLDSICVVERAHHHILWTRMAGYRRGLLEGLQARGRVFEHWTHDASVIPARWFPHWRHRFDRITWESWLRKKMGAEYRVVLDSVRERIAREGPLAARDFEHKGKRSGPWWDWKPAKAALEYWWRQGELAVPRRVRFEKVYDLTERVLPEVWRLPAPSREEHIEWACRTALERLGVATPRQIAQFWNAVTAAEAGSWCRAAAATGEIVPVDIERARKGAYAWSDWRSRAERARQAGVPEEMRLLSPFDPLIRDRARCQALFGFDYRFEAFVPEARRKYGYYVLPVLHKDRLVARIDPKLDREAGVLRVRGVWWEPGMKPTASRRRELRQAVERYAAFAGAAKVEGVS
jgi:uncharacterized protein